MLLAGAALAPFAAAAQPRDAVASNEIPGAVNVLGFGDIKPQSGGKLSFAPQGITFANDKEQATIPFAAVQAFSIEHSTTGILRGTGSAVARNVPYGGGQLYSAIRLGAETLTIFYRDEHKALHGAVVILPKDRKDDALQAFAAARLRPGVGPAAGLALTKASARKRGKRQRSVPVSDVHAVQVALPATLAPDLPTAFTAGIYEELVEKLGQNSAFDAVWRQGDDRAAPNALALNLTVTKLQKGSAAVRGAIPIVGMLAGKTLITADLQLANSTGTPLVRQTIKGSKRWMGESMIATSSLAERASKALQDAPVLAGKRTAQASK
ncbi:DUF4410 domain-containing protein [Sphingomonas immobilis]|uniref:Uncharacterized protein n=1 Tax=Sphingomonas immobilis TaxID=3063997 RepID=A0ABT8ZYP3_9SPHN|nr:hypothetical protein [Sphingomonas sp. CA1-15]MDO7842700.1 hypothetical protein [Sphingomonas sp. CA1-15]